MGLEKFVFTVGEEGEISFPFFENFDDIGFDRNFELSPFLTADMENIGDNFIHFVDTLVCDLNCFDILLRGPYFNKGDLIFEFNYGERSFKFVGSTDKKLFLVFEIGRASCRERV